MPTYEVFLSEDGRESFRHAGALDAPDEEMAVLYAREAYVRRGEGSRAWVVARSHIVEVDPSDLAIAATRMQGRNDGKKIAERRQERRAAGAAVGREVAPTRGGNPPPSDAGRRSAPISGGNLSPNAGAQQ